MVAAPQLEPQIPPEYKPILNVLEHLVIKLLVAPFEKYDWQIQP